MGKIICVAEFRAQSSGHRAQVAWVSFAESRKRKGILL